MKNKILAGRNAVASTSAISSRSPLISATDTSTEVWLRSSRLRHLVTAANLGWGPVQRLAPSRETIDAMVTSSDCLRFGIAGVGVQLSAGLLALQLARDCFEPMGQSPFNPSGKPLPYLGCIILAAALPALVVEGSLAINAVALGVHTLFHIDRPWVGAHPAAAHRGGHIVSAAAALTAAAATGLWATGLGMQHDAGWMNDASYRDGVALIIASGIASLTVVPMLGWYAGQGVGAVAATAAECAARGFVRGRGAVVLGPDEP